MLKIEKVHPRAIVPKRANSTDSGLDLYSTEDLHIPPKQTRLVPTGWKMSVPQGYEIQIRPRSGLSLKTNLRIANSPGTCDSSYRGEIKVIMDNFGDCAEEISAGDRIAQAVVCPVLLWTPEIVDSLEKTDRGEGGFGSTGI